jgi:hypothetical protein
VGGFIRWEKQAGRVVGIYDSASGFPAAYERRNIDETRCLHADQTAFMSLTVTTHRAGMYMARQQLVFGIPATTPV